MVFQTSAARVLAASVLLSAIAIASARAQDAASPTDHSAVEAFVHAEVARQLADASAASHNADLAARTHFASLSLQRLRSEIELYKIQHNDHYPLSLDALVKRTSPAGASPDKSANGPHLESLPINDFNNSNAVSDPGAATATTGWTYDPQTGTVALVLPPGVASLAHNFPPDLIQIVNADPVASPPELVGTLTVDRVLLAQTIHNEVQSQLANILHQERVADVLNGIRAAHSTLETLRGQIMLYKIQHADKPPASFAALLAKTDEAGVIFDGAPYGPYIQSTPHNPFNGQTLVCTRATATPATGWIYEPATGSVVAVLPASLAPLADEMKGDVELLVPALQDHASAAPTH